MRTVSNPESRSANLTSAARHAAIMSRVEIGPVRVEQLAELFNVSRMTIHRDLDALAASDRLERIRGGARPLPHEFHETDLALRRAFKVEQKSAIARIAASLVSDDETIAIDDSSTAGAMLEHLDTAAQLTVITHSLAVMRELSTRFPRAAMFGIGGRYYPETDSFLHVSGSAQIGSLHADTVFVSTTALKSGALFHPDAEAAETKKALLSLADRKVLLIDSSKFEANGRFRVVGLAVFDDVIVEAPLSESARAELEGFAGRIHEARIE